MKLCGKCKLIKSIDLFNKNKSKKDGLSSWCKACNYTYRTSNKDIILKNNKKYKEENKEELKEKAIIYMEKNKDKIRLYQREYKKEHKSSKKYEYVITDERKNYKKEWVKNDRKNKPWIYSHRDLLNRLIKRINYNKKYNTNMELGYSPDDLRLHIENIFLEGMSWNNRHKWHIDHIKPISSFEKDTPAYIINALSNLQPLWKEDNLKKSNKIIGNKDL